VHFVEHLGIDKIEHELAHAVGHGINSHHLLHPLLAEIGVDGAVVEKILPHLPLLEIHEGVDGGVETYLPPVRPDLLIEDPLYRFAEYIFAIAVPDEMAGGNRVGEGKEAGIEERAPVLHRIKHGIKVVFMEDHGDGFVKEFVEHPVSEDRIHIVLFVEILREVLLQGGDEFLAV